MMVPSCLISLHLKDHITSSITLQGKCSFISLCVWETSAFFFVLFEKLLSLVQMYLNYDLYFITNILYPFIFKTFISFYYSTHLLLALKYLLHGIDLQRRCYISSDTMVLLYIKNFTHKNLQILFRFFSTVHHIKKVSQRREQNETRAFNTVIFFFY